MKNPFIKCDCAKNETYRLGDLIKLPGIVSFVFNDIKDDQMIMYVGLHDGCPMGRVASSNKLIKLDLDMMVKDVF